MSQLLPDGIRSLRDAPYPLFRAVRIGLQYLSFEDLPEEDVPPRSIWTDFDALKDWFDEVRRRQKERLSGKEIEDPQRNSALDFLIVGDK